MNVPEGAFDYRHGAFAAATPPMSIVCSTLSPAGLDLLVQRGIADPMRMGIIGRSYDAFWTDYIITYYPD